MHADDPSRGGLRARLASGLVGLVGLARGSWGSRGSWWDYVFGRIAFARSEVR